MIDFSWSVSPLRPYVLHLNGNRYKQLSEYEKK
jgi:hypothetical protein